MLAGRVGGAALRSCRAARPGSPGPAVPFQSTECAGRATIWDNEAIVSISPRTACYLRPRRRGWAVSGVAALAAAGLLAAASAGAEVPGSGAARLLPASLQPADAAAAASPAAPGDSDIRNRIESTAGLVIAGERLHGGLLRQFYTAHNFQPVW